MKVIATGDMHLHGGTPPVCRLDDYYNTQAQKLQFIESMCKKHNAIHIDAGDILDRFNGGRTNAEALKTFKLIAQNVSHMYGIYGNHDLKLLNKQYLNESLISALDDAGIITLINGLKVIDDELFLYGFNYGDTIKHVDLLAYNKDDYPRIALYHGYVSQEKDPFINGLVASEIVKEFENDYHFIITADNHTPFVCEGNGCTLINVGSLCRTTIKQIDYQPHIYLIDTDNMSYEAIPVPIIDGVISTEHKDKVEHKTNTMESVVNVVKNSEGVELSFDNELEQIIHENEKIMSNRVHEYIDIVTEKYEKYTR